MLCIILINHCCQNEFNVKLSSFSPSAVQKKNPQQIKQMLQVDNLAELGSLTEVIHVHAWYTGFYVVKGDRGKDPGTTRGRDPGTTQGKIPGQRGGQ